MDGEVEQTTTNDGEESLDQTTEKQSTSHVLDQVVYNDLVKKRGRAKGRVTRVRRRIEHELRKTEEKFVSLLSLQSDVEKILPLIDTVNDLSEQIGTLLENCEADERVEDALIDLEAWDDGFDHECTSVSDARALLDYRGVGTHSPVVTELAAEAATPQKATRHDTTQEVVVVDSDGTDRPTGELLESKELPATGTGDTESAAGRLDSPSTGVEARRSTMSTGTDISATTQNPVAQAQHTDTTQAQPTVPTPTNSPDMIQAMALAAAHAATAAAGLSTAPQPSRLNVQLPKLTLPSFSGKVIEWPEFWERFQSSIDNQPIADVSKFSYLKSCLSGDAAKAIAGISLTSANYTTVKDLLKTKYGSAEIIIASLYSRLEALPAPPNRPMEIHRSFETVECLLRQLETQGEKLADQRLLCQKLWGKVPLEVATKFEEWRGISNAGQPWKLTTLREYMAKYTTLQEQLRQRTGQGPPNKPDAVGVQPKQLFSTADALAAHPDTQGRPQRSRRGCIFCDGQHMDNDCSRYTSSAARKQRLMELRRCFICLGSGHRSQECYRRQTQTCRMCKHPSHHHHTICSQSRQPSGVGSHSTRRADGSSSTAAVAASDTTTATCTPTQVPGQAVASDQTVASDQSSCLLQATGSTVTLQTATTNVQGNNGTITTARVLLDSGSHRTYFTEALARQLSLRHTRHEWLSVSTFGATKHHTAQVPISDLFIHLKDGTTKAIEGSVLPHITNPVLRPAVAHPDITTLQQLQHDNQLADAINAEDERLKIDILIGSDYLWDFVQGHVQPLPSGLNLLPTSLGYVVTGKTDTSPTTALPATTLIAAAADVSHEEVLPLKQSIPDLWSLETLGIEHPSPVKDDDVALQHFHSTVECTDNRYIVRWPWNGQQQFLPDNYGLTLGRFRTLSRRLSTDSSLLEQYDKVIQQQADMGIIEQMTPDSVTGPQLHYLPHQPVLTPTKTTTKLRVVYDASAKARRHNKSLNNCLLRGPVLLPNLAGVLMRLRITPILLVADIEKAFLQLDIWPPDRDVTRFLWYRDPTNPTATPDNIAVYRFRRVPFGIVSSPFLLAATIQHHLANDEDADVGRLVSRNIYVDNVFIGVDTPEEGYDMCNRTTSVFSRSSMRLREWASNNSHATTAMDAKERAQGDSVNVLGITWHTKDDSLQLACPRTQPSTDPVWTKRAVLKYAASLYDPLGLVAPVTFRIKVFLRSLWQAGMDWDTVLTGHLLDTWLTLHAASSEVSSLSFPRQINPIANGTDATYQLHVFTDASQLGFATVVYLRTTIAMMTTCELLFGKTRLAPLKSKDGKPNGLTLPRLELLGVTIGSRAARFCKDELDLPLTSITLWTDARCVLHWIKSSKPLSVFVANRVSEIRTCGEFLSFRHVPGECNPADVASRGGLVADLQESWWHGPDWLRTTSDHWPDEDLTLSADESDLASKEEQAPTLHTASLVTGGSDRATDQPSPHTIPSGLGSVLTRASSLRKVLRITALCMKFLKKLRPNSPRLSQISNSYGIVSQDIQAARDWWTRMVQREAFPDIFKAIKTNAKHSSVANLGVVIDDNGILRCAGRLSNAELPTDQKLPKLLPTYHAFTKHVISEVHGRLLHAGVRHTLAQTRQEFWIIRGRAIVRRILDQCSVCRRHEGRPFKLPSMPPWPKERITRALPFTYVGLDYLGPLLIRTGTEKGKVWINLVTCLTTRAVHLDIVSGLSAAAFLNSMRRFAARRGKPKSIVCDNAPQFKLVRSVLDDHLKLILANPDLLSYLSTENIEWSFTTEFAPWKGGVYERLVSIVKRALRKSLGRCLLTLDQLATLTAEVEGMINTRPLTYVDDDDVSSFSPLTPSHFLCGGRTATGFQTDSDEEDGPETPAAKVTRMWKRQQIQLDVAWKVWEDEYLPALREASMSQHRQSRSSISRTPTVGEVVVIQETGQPRGSWRLGRVVEILPGVDGQVRAVKLKTAKSKAVLSRPISKLYPLELHVVDDVGAVEAGDMEHRPAPATAMEQAMADEAAPTMFQPRRANRKAAEKARERIAEWVR